MDNQVLDNVFSFGAFLLGTRNRQAFEAANAPGVTWSGECDINRRWDRKGLDKWSVSNLLPPSDLRATYLHVTLPDTSARKLTIRPFSLPLRFTLSCTTESPAPPLFLRRPRGPFHLFCHPSAVGRGTDARTHLLEFHARKEFHRDRMSVEWVGEPKLCQQCIVWIRLLDLVCVWI